MGIHGFAGISYAIQGDPQLPLGIITRGQNEHEPIVSQGILIYKKNEKNQYFQVATVAQIAYAVRVQLPVPEALYEIAVHVSSSEG